MIITDEKELKIYIEKASFNLCWGKDWEELWNTSVCVRGVLVENITVDDIWVVDEKIEEASKPLLPYANFATYILICYETANKYIWNRYVANDFVEVLDENVLQGLCAFYVTVQNK